MTLSLHLTLFFSPTAPFLLATTPIPAPRISPQLLPIHLFRFSFLIYLSSPLHPPSKHPPRHHTLPFLISSSRPSSSVLFFPKSSSSLHRNPSSDLACIPSLGSSRLPQPISNTTQNKQTAFLFPLHSFPKSGQLSPSFSRLDSLIIFSTLSFPTPPYSFTH